jgi:hypothetical protein
MANTRNKSTYTDWVFSERLIKRQQDWVMNPAPCMNNHPAFPVGGNNPRMASSILSNNAVDIESNLYGIGANNFINPPKCTPRLVTLPNVVFVAPPPVYIPKLPPPLVNQRPF